ncbi:GAF domain-containing sensor histidine kinase [Thermorudis peleae]|uniref:GAF domain-containing sensor histidine kinase n=1 Tax=Thermorudis peleae TaxID=1382356 RepID=UPI00068DD76D|nr:GAF domain-containing sensor histidine kinase [Thermorudis peleae]
MHVEHTPVSFPPERQLQRLRWAGVAIPALGVTTALVIGYVLEQQIRIAWLAWTVAGCLLWLGIVLFAATMFNTITTLQRAIIAQHNELAALHEAGLAMMAELDLPAVLQDVVDRARALVDAQYGLLVTHETPNGPLVTVTSGYPVDEPCDLPTLPSHGILDRVFHHGEPLLINDLSAYPGTRNFPEGHPVMQQLLGVPIRRGDVSIAALYLADRRDGTPFTQRDLERLSRFATIAGLAIMNAQLHRQITTFAVAAERERIAREMHDSLAQVLGYVMTKAAAVQELLRQEGRQADAERQLQQLADAARAAYADVREAILALRTGLSESSLADALRAYGERWQEQSGIQFTLDFALDPADLERLSPMAELQLLRIVQEALTNIRKHAHATLATVRFVREGDFLVVTVQDDGQGFDPSSLSRTDYPRFGLATMRERAEAVGGELQLHSVLGEGTTVTVRLPLGTRAIMREASHARPHR